MPQPFVGFSLQSIPLAEIARLSRGRMLPCSYPPTRRKVATRTLLPLVSSTPALSRSCLTPPTTMDSLFTFPKERFPVILDPSDGTLTFR